MMIKFKEYDPKKDPEGIKQWIALRDTNKDKFVEY